MVVEFIRIHIIYELDVIEIIKVHNGHSFKSVALYELYVKYQVNGNYSSLYHAPTKGLAEVSNKTLYIILEKMVNTNKKTGPG